MFIIAFPPTPINYAAYWGLSYSFILQTFSE